MITKNKFDIGDEVYYNNKKWLICAIRLSFWKTTKGWLYDACDNFISPGEWTTFQTEENFLSKYEFEDAELKRLQEERKKIDTKIQELTGQIGDNNE